MALAAALPRATRPAPLRVVLPAMTKSVGLPIELSPIVPVFVIVPVSCSALPSPTAMVPALLDALRMAKVPPATASVAAASLSVRAPTELLCVLVTV